jgi:iron(III) transport system permease protein
VLCLLGWAACLLLATARLRGLLLNSALLAAGALVISLPLGTLLAVAITKTSLWGRGLLRRGLIVMLFVPLYVQAAAWQACLGQGGWLSNQGWLTGWRGAIWIHGVASIAWVVLLVSAALRKVPRALEEEALQNTTPWRVLLQVSLPTARPALCAAALWITVICFTEIAVTDLFQVRTFAEEVYTAASLGTLDPRVTGPVLPGSEQGIVWGAHELCLGTLAIACLVAAAVTALWQGDSATYYAARASDWTWQLRPRQWPLRLAVWLLVAVVVGAPLLGLLGKAGAQLTPTETGVRSSWSARQAVTLIASSPWQHRRELGWSLWIAAGTTIPTILVASLLAWTLRTQRWPKWPVVFALSLGFSLPGPLLGVWVIRCLNQPPESLWAPLTWYYDHTILAPVLVQFLKALPLATLLLGAQCARLPQELLDSAQTEGAGWWQQYLRIALPWCGPALVAATGMTLIVSISDLAATLLVVPPGISPLSVRIFGLLHYGAEDQVCALCLMVVLLLGTLVTVADLFFRWRNPGH